MTNKLAVGVDIGGTKVLAVALDADSTMVAEHRVPTPKDPDELLDAIEAAVVNLAVDVGTIGIGIAGLVTSDGAVRVSPHLSHPERLDLVGTIGARLHAPVRVDNDANAATWGEARLGAGRGVRDLVVITLGTGIGAGIVCNGQLVRGAHGFGGEPGHMTVNFDGPPYITGARGSWEQYGSGSALYAADGTLTAADLATPEGVTALAHYAEMVAIGVGNLVNLLDPEAVIIGGGVSALGEPLRAAVEAHLAPWAFGFAQRVRLRVVLAELGEEAGAVGAALLGALPRV